MVAWWYKLTENESYTWLVIQGVQVVVQSLRNSDDAT